MVLINMRRKDREVTDISRIKEIMESCTCCHLGLVDGKYPYIVPLSFGFEESEGRFTLYFHGAKEGRKAELIQRHPYACFEMETGYEIIKSDTACHYSANYQSIIGEGNIEMLETTEQKKEALQFIMRHYTGKQGWNFPTQMLEATCAMKLEIEKLSCKVHG